eukprot:1471071-Pyramimonas_sp.AAC.1
MGPSAFAAGRARASRPLLRSLLPLLPLPAPVPPLFFPRCPPPTHIIPTAETQACYQVGGLLF